MVKKAISVKELEERFQFSQVVGDEESLNRTIEIAEISRPGFELAGFFQHSDMRRIIIWRKRNCIYFTSFKRTSRRTF